MSHLELVHLGGLTAWPGCVNSEFQTKVIIFGDALTDQQLAYIRSGQGWPIILN